jgi:hypothetical protein
MLLINEQEEINMDDLLESVAMACIAGAFLVAVFMCAWYPPMHEAKKVDCSLAEFSPDISLEIKQLCREARKSR